MTTSNPSDLSDTQQIRPAQPHKGGRVQSACYSLPGKVRQNNEDACALPPPGANLEAWGTLVVVADGVGGLPGGELASRQAVAYLQALYYAQDGAPDPATRLAEGFEAVNALNHLCARRAGLAQPGLTTLVAAQAKDNLLQIANVGDSRAYLIQAAAHTRKQLTEDHSSRVQALKAGMIDNASIDRLSNSSAITRAIGMGERFQLDSYRYTWQPGDALVLCSDGLAQLPEAEMIAVVLKFPPDAAARRLVERAVELDGGDNCTAAVMRWPVYAITGREVA